MGTIAQNYSDVRTRMPEWLLGQLIERSSNDQIRTAINKSPQAKSVYTITVDTATNSATYTWTVGESGRQVELTYVADSSTSAGEVADGIAAAINANGVARGQCSASSDGVSVVTVTGNWPGIEVVVSDSDAKITSAQVTAAASADAIAFGRAVIHTGDDGPNEQVALAKSSLFSMQVQTITVAYVASAVLLCEVYEVRGAEEHLIGQAAVTSATDRDTTLDALITAINANLPANSVVVTADNATATALVFTSEVGGLEFKAYIRHGGGGASAPAITSADTTGPSEATSFHRAFRGISLHSHMDPAATIGGTTGQYAGNAGVSYARKGVVAVASSQTITAGELVYVELGVTADNGKFFNTDSATRIAVARNLLSWVRDGDSSTSTLAAIRANA